jgi:transcription-repair coupling factor (superfamily II helicase)
MSAAGQRKRADSSSPGDLLDLALKVADLDIAVNRAAAGNPVVFENVAAPARGFVAALIAKACFEKGRSAWFICANLREQEDLFNSLALWHGGALFFPEMEMAAVEGALPDPEIAAERLSVLSQLAASNASGAPTELVATAQSLDDPVPSAADVSKSDFTVAVRDKIYPGSLIERLAGAGYERAPQVTARGQFAMRGGIMDVFSWHHAVPVRIEFFEDEIESIREFDIDTQISIRKTTTADLFGAAPKPGKAKLRSYAGKGRIIDVESGHDVSETVITSAGRSGGAFSFDDATAGRLDPGDFVLAEAKRDHVLAQIREWLDAGWSVNVVCANEGEEQRLRELIPASEGIGWLRGALARGFIFVEGRLAVLADAELFGRFQTPRARRGGAARRFSAPIDFTSLNEGDLVVHLDNGIGRFERLATMPDGTEVLVLEYAQSAKLYVPVEQAYLVSRYVGIGRRQPDLSVLGDGKWARAKAGVEKSVQSFAAKLLRMQAERETSRGHAFSPDKPWQIEFENSFPYKETPDQLTAIAASKRDMESDRPMDRLICGDVGFGKTEVAIRTAFKAVMDGKQVAVLAPTTVLAQQHFATFRERMSDYPVRVDVLSRFRTRKETLGVIAAVATGEVDIVIGTHRLISGDVKFKDLGLVVIDEEQRFGVLHKERFKSMFNLIDQLTLSATPIPRTLYLSLMGAKDMSAIETPPPNRYPVETIVCAYDERIMRDAIKRELERRGQVYVLHNRVGTIENFAAKIRLLCPGARVEIGHGQMSEHELEDVMARFVEGKTDVLVATTIIESGLDIPNANTIIIDRADRFGLADLYQLRGRVGRAQHKAYAYLMLPRDMMTAGAARKRINAIKQYSSLGAGFKVAMRDLEIRGAGNILGTEQSGHVLTVGFDLYCTLLRHAIAQIRQDSAPPVREVPVSIDFLVTIEGTASAHEDRVPAFVSRQYIGETRVRIDAYRQLADAGDDAAVERTGEQWRDRFGPLPEAAQNLLLLARIKLEAAKIGLQHLEVREDRVMMRRGGDFVLIGGKFPRLTSQTSILKFREILKVLQAFSRGQ